MMTAAFQEDESEFINDSDRILRAVLTASMQTMESQERVRAAREKTVEQAQKLTADERNQAANAIRSTVTTREFWDHGSNQHMAENVVAAQQLAKEHPAAAQAYMVLADGIQDRYGVDVDRILTGAVNDPNRALEQLRRELDDHNARGRARQEASADLEAAPSAPSPVTSSPEAQASQDTPEMEQHERLVEHGAAPYQNDPEQKESYFVTVENAEGEQRTYWGVDLERAITESGADIGDAIDVEHVGSTPVTLPNGQKTHRNTWRVDVVEAASEQGHDEQAESSRYSEEIRAAAASEATEAGLPVDGYLDRLSENDREQLLDESRRGIEDSPARDERIERAAEAAEIDARKPQAEETATDNTRATDPTGANESEATREADGASTGRSSETEPVVSAAHDREMQRHLDTVAATDPKAAEAVEARKTALLNHPKDASSSFEASLDTKATPRKAHAQKQVAAKQAERTR